MEPITVCIEDFCGYSEPGHYPTEFWADYDLDAEACYFGGDWADVPPLHTETAPTNAQAHAWVKQCRDNALRDAYPDPDAGIASTERPIPASLLPQPQADDPATAARLARIDADGLRYIETQIVNSWPG